jgi:hypothetical protein
VNGAGAHPDKELFALIDEARVLDRGLSEREVDHAEVQAEVRPGASAREGP